MRFRKIIPFILIALLIVSCQSSLEKGKYTNIDAKTLADFWQKKGGTSNSEGLLLGKQNEGITSKFSVRNFEFSVKLKSTAGAEGMLAFAIPGESKGSPAKGYTVFINNSDYRVGDTEKTGSLLFIRNNFVRTAYDDQWFDLTVSVEANHIKVSVNNKVVSEYKEPAHPKRPADLAGMILSKGNLSIQKTNDAGQLLIGEMKIKPLEDKLRIVTIIERNDSITDEVDHLNNIGFPLIDFHGHLKGGLTMDQACQHARDNGYNYGIAANCGLKFPVTNDSTLNAYLNGISQEPVFKVMQAEGREWITLFSPKAVARFDYIFTDAMTWTDYKGRRLRLWIPEETFVDNDQQFMDMLVGKIEAIIGKEPVDIYVNPTFLPASIMPKYDELWTTARMDRVIKVLKDNDVALEINARYKIPSIAFIKRAKAAGVKFTFGTNNTTNNDLGRLEYCLKAIKEAGITAGDIFLPRPVNDKKVIKVGLPSKVTG
jgi:hypothetical protein